MKKVSITKNGITDQVISRMVEPSICWASTTGFAAILDGEHGDDKKDERGHDARNHQQIDVQSVHLPRDGRGPIRPQW